MNPHDDNEPTPIPPAILQKIEEPAPVKQRHTQIVRIVGWLINLGFMPKAIFNALRPRYPANGPDAIPDDEILSVIDGSWRYFCDQGTAPHGATKIKPLAHSQVDSETAVRNIEALLGGRRVNEEKLRLISPIKLRDNPVSNAFLFFSLFERDDLINLVKAYTLTSPDKAAPNGFGQTQSCAHWKVQIIKKDRLPESDAGSWIRINPVDGRGIADKNVKVHRYTLLELDSVSQDLQLSLLSILRLPIAALVKSGGKSIHAWIRVDAASEPEYSDVVHQLFELVAPFGFDLANKNPSRLARLPGATRKIGATGDGLQKLLYLNPEPKPEAIFQ